MAVIGATELQPVNVVSNYLAGRESRQNQLAQQQEMAARQQQMAMQQRAAQREEEAAAAATQNALARRQALATGDPKQIAAAGFVDEGSKLAAMQKDQEEASRKAREFDLGNMASEAGAFANDPQMLSKAVLMPWVQNYVDLGVISLDAAERFAAMPDDPQQLSQAMTRISRQGLTAYEQVQAANASRTADIQASQVAATRSGQDITARTAMRGQDMVDARAKATADAAAVAPPVKLKPGERINPTTGAIEATPGSAEFIKQSKSHGADYATLKGIQAQSKLATDKIDSLLDPKNKSAFSNLFGGYNAYVSQLFSGETANLKSRLDSLKDNLKTAGLQLIKQGSGQSIGQITQTEWPILERMISKLDPTLTEQEAALRLGEIKTFMEQLETRAREQYEVTWGETQFKKDVSGGGAAPPAGARPASPPKDTPKGAAPSRRTSSGTSYTVED